ncbi:MAG: 30S ribosomal protein S9 [Verrucomicrobiae bacterium]|nr:30S ribosomal protein S9 [Verrucomicrobiae bacterium]
MVDTTVQEFIATGRRKSAVARVRIMPGTGRITVNNHPFEEYFPVETLRALATRALYLTNTQNVYDVWVNVTGGGPTGQAGAIRLGIARALLETDSNLKPLLRSEGLLTRDPREKERKKYGQPGARKRFQYSKR